MMTLNELIRELQEIRSQTEDYDMGELPVDIAFNNYLPDVMSVRVVELAGKPVYVRIDAS